MAPTLYETHHLIEHTNKNRGEGSNKLVPQVVGMSIPRDSSSDWPLFVLAHFKPFGISQPLIDINNTCENVFSNYSFSEISMTVMKIWNTIYECEDEHDKEQLLKHAKTTAKCLALTLSIAASSLDTDDLDNVISRKTLSAESFRIQQVILVMHQSNWLTPYNCLLNKLTDDNIVSTHHLNPDLDVALLDVTPNLLKI